MSAEPADPAMLELFRSECEGHVQTLNQGLLALETKPESADAWMESLMRAAHAIKGGARIVGLDPAVKVAHGMEDYFVAAQKQAIAPDPAHIDALLAGADLLHRIAEAAAQSATLPESDAIAGVVRAIAALLDPPSPDEPPEPADPDSQRPASPPSEPETAPSTGAPDKQAPSPLEPVQSTPPSEPEKNGDLNRMVRVTAKKLERLMGLAGEVVVRTRWLPTFFNRLMSLKKKHNALFDELEKLRAALEAEDISQEAARLMNQVRERAKDCNQSLLERLGELDQFNSGSAALSDRLYHEAIEVRMCPLADGIGGYARMVRDLAKELGKKARLDIRGETTEVDRDILEKLDAPLNHLLRNAVAHGIEAPPTRLAAGKAETGCVRLEARHQAGMLVITVSDDGQGVDPERLRQEIVEKAFATPDIARKLTPSELLEFLFLPGFSTASAVTEIAGRGVGLDLVHAMVHEVGGVARVFSNPDGGLSFQLELPLTLSVIRTFLVEIANEPYAFPLARIERCLMLPKARLRTVEDRQYFRMDQQNIALVSVHDVLELPPPQQAPDELPIVVLSDRHHAYGLAVDRFIGECDLVVRPLDPRLGKIPDISAAAIMLDGMPVLIFDPDDLVRSIDKLLSTRRRPSRLEPGDEQSQSRPKRILVADDSVTVREMERRILENQGYAVDIAVDGMEAWNLLRTVSYDLLVTDIDMPRMNGFELIRQVRGHASVKGLPVVVVSYKNKQEDRLQGLEAGANYYLTKNSFQDNSFVEAIADLIGEV